MLRAVKSLRGALALLALSTFTTACPPSPKEEPSSEGGGDDHGDGDGDGDDGESTSGSHGGRSDGGVHSGDASLFDAFIPDEINPDTIDTCTPESPSGLCYRVIRSHTLEKVELAGSEIAVGSSHGVTIGFSAADQSSGFSFMFPRTSYPVAGRYEVPNPDVMPFDQIAARLSVGLPGLGCDTEGFVDITEVAFDGLGAVTRFAATFDGKCPKASAIVRGAVNWNVTGERDPRNVDPTCEPIEPTGLCQVARGRHELPLKLTLENATWHRAYSSSDIQRLVLDILVPDRLMVLSFGNGETSLGVGIYANARDAAGAGPQMSINCGSEGSALALGRFDVREWITTPGPDEYTLVIARAAIDYDYECPDGSEVHGMLRYTASSLP